MPRNFIQTIQSLFGNRNTSLPMNTPSISRATVPNTTAASLDIIYDLIQGRLTVQKDQWTALDVKINFILSYATALVSASLILQAVLLTLHNAHGGMLSNLTPYLSAQLLSVTCLLLLLVFYITTVIIGIFAYKPRAYRIVPDPKEIFRGWLNKEEGQTKQIVVEKMIEAFELNQTAVNRKLRLIDYALATLFVEAFLLVPLIAIQVVS